MSRSQREYVLRQQMETIKRELGETDDRDSEFAELRERMRKLDLPDVNAKTQGIARAQRFSPKTTAPLRAIASLR